jgi:hypothetical protein
MYHKHDKYDVVMQRWSPALLFDVCLWEPPQKCLPLLAKEQDPVLTTQKATGKLVNGVTQWVHFFTLISQFNFCLKKGNDKITKFSAKENYQFKSFTV